MFSASLASPRRKLLNSMGFCSDAKCDITNQLYVTDSVTPQGLNQAAFRSKDCTSPPIGDRAEFRIAH